MPYSRLVMNPDAILQAFAHRAVDCILIGGMNFALRHQPVTTYALPAGLRRLARIRYLTALLP